jgi:cell wall-associated NlpC family hydrolase
VSAPFLIGIAARAGRRRRSGVWIAGGAVGVVGLLGTVTILLPLLMYGGTGLGIDDSSTAAQPSGCAPLAVRDGVSVTLDGDQQANARTIITTGKQLGVPPQGLVVAVATALQESTLRNLDYGDRDSVGLFQQRPSTGWGTVAQLTDPPTAAGKFFRALLQVPGWQSLPVTVAAQTVQRSAFPMAYAKWEALATSLVNSVTGAQAYGCSSAAGTKVPDGTSGLMLRVALAQQGKPYFWGGTGPAYFDCSGLVVYSWRQAGYQLSVRTSEQMSSISTPVLAGSEQPGDLLFGEYGPNGAGHVMIVIQPGSAVEAPKAGDVVKVVNYHADGTSWRLGRLPASAFTRLPSVAALS